jgi:hypothetical protein
MVNANIIKNVHLIYMYIFSLLKLFPKNKKEICIVKTLIKKCIWIRVDQTYLE